MSSARETDVDPDDLLEASMEWINSKPSQRINCMEEILQKVQLLECSVECIESEMETHEALFMRSPAGYRLINKALLQIAKQAGVRQKRGANTKSQTILVAVGGQSGSGTRDLNKVCWTFNVTLQLEELCKIPDHSLRLGVCRITDGFVLTGGEDSTLCSMYVLSTNSWKQLKSMKTARRAHGSIYMNQRIFVIGGNTSVATSVHSLAINGDNWTEADLPIPVSYPEVVSGANSMFLLYSDANQLLHLDMKAKVIDKSCQVQDVMEQGWLL